MIYWAHDQDLLAVDAGAALSVAATRCASGWRRSLAWFILDVVSQLHLRPIEAAIQGKDPREQRPYHPAMMVTLLVNAYCTGVYSSRRIERACHEDVVGCVKVKSVLIHDHIDHSLEHAIGPASRKDREPIQEFKKITKYL